MGCHAFISQSLLKVMSVESVMPSNHLILCHPSFSPSAFSLSQYQSFSSELALCIRWPKYWSFGFSIGPSNECSGLISFRIDWFDLLAVQGTLKSSLGPQLKSINYSVLFMSSLCLILTPIHDYWKDHIFDSIDLCWQSDLSAF